MAADHNVVNLLKRREVDDSVARKIQGRLHVTEELLLRLGLEKELEGHTGCVNCLEWNESGRLLASASDDLRVIIWDPLRHKQISSLTTNHHGNIFSVKFMPKSNDRIVVTGAGDFMINVHDISLSETTNVCSCHASRVKRLATVPDCPYMFWSASEDGTIRQFDLRSPHTCRSDYPNVLVSLKRCMGRLGEAKCLAINPVRPELLAVGANDPFVRIYDRRMLRTISVPKTEHYPSSDDKAGNSSKNDYLPEGCVEYFVAGHLPAKQSSYEKKFRNLASTYLTFGADGRDLLVNLGGEQIYLFDIYSKRESQKFDFKQSPYYYKEESTSSKADCSDNIPGTNGYKNGSVSSHRWILAQSSESSSDPLAQRQALPTKVEGLRLQANVAFEGQNYYRAVHLYNEAISLCSGSAILYGNRAAALMKRDWDGDMYAALRDCQTTLELEPNHYKAHFRMIRCLHELSWTSEASDCLLLFKNKFPQHAQNTACRALEKDINTATAAKAKIADDQAKSEKEDSVKTGTASWEINVASFRPKRSEQELKGLAKATDYESRFCGHCNTTTDIKEANFFGEDGQYIVAGSDDGSIYFWERSTTNNIRILKGDGSIVNCLQPHPTYCLLASSGIDPVVRLWSPLPQDGRKDDREINDKDVAADANQKRMKADPFDVVMLNLGYNSVQLSERPNGEEDAEDEDLMSRMPPNCSCRPS